MSELHDSLKKVEDIKLPSGKKINLYNHISKIKESAKVWLSGLEKNGYDHSERIEKYLDALTKNLRKTKKITPGEIFILLSSTYMHDIGYNLMGKNVSTGHASRSQEMILKNPSKYHFGDFPPFKGDYPRIAEAVGLVCLGHKIEPSNDILDQIPDEFPDYIFPNEELNLRKITALLRLADEADDPYIRFNISDKSIRNRIPLVQIKDNTIIWYWDRTLENDPSIFSEFITEKIENLATSIDYLRSVGAGTWYIVLHPQIRKNQVSPLKQESRDSSTLALNVKEKNILRDNFLQIQKPSELKNKPQIAIVGCGGAGNQIIHRIFQKHSFNLDTIAVHTNKGYLDTIMAQKRVLIGRSLTRGFGAHGDPNVGRKAAEDGEPTLEVILESSDIVFIVAGMGGGTGTGAAPVVARIAKKQGALVVAIVTYPFKIERPGIKRAEKGINEILTLADTTILVDCNDYRNISPNLTIDEIFSLIDRQIAETVSDICLSITEPTSIKIGVSDLWTILKNGGLSTISMVETNDKSKIEYIVRRCFDTFFNINLNDTKGAFIHLTAGKNITISDIERIDKELSNRLSSNTEVIYGARLNNNMQEKLRLIVLLTGLEFHHKFPIPKKKLDS